MSICFQLFRLQQCRRLSFVTCFLRYAQIELFLRLFPQQSADESASLICHVMQFVVGKHVCFIAHGNRGVSAEQIFTCCVVLPQEVRRRRRRTSPFVNRTGERILCNHYGALICFSQRMTQHTVEEGERKRPAKPSPLFRT